MFTSGHVQLSQFTSSHPTFNYMTKMQTEEVHLHHLVFIPGPGISHIVPAVEFVKLMINRDTRLLITFLLFNDPMIHSYKQSLCMNPNPRLRFQHLPQPEENSTSNPDQTKPHFILAMELINSHKPMVREAVLSMIESKLQVNGLIVDMFCMNMIDVANEFDIPSYSFFTCSAAFLSFKLYNQAVYDHYNLDIAQNKSGTEKYPVPGFLNHVPESVFLGIIFDESNCRITFQSSRRIRETKGVLVNTFLELESVLIDALGTDHTGGSYVPPVYPVGPILNLGHETNWDADEEGVTTSWLNDQPANSVVFLCFGSMGRFNEEQIKHIAVALEHCSHRFLWSLRSRSSSEEVLPLGFLERTAGVGKVIGWAPQVDVLAHPAVGGFVTHCGWNSILESLWFGVPMAAWPMYAEQQLNAFEMVVELGLATEIKIDYREELGEENIVTSDEIEKGINQLMMERVDNGVIMRKVKDMQEKSRNALLEGGSSYKFLGCFLDDMLKNCSRD